jgi:two-component system phosphate regulon sensor histidine kinase PhoR
MSKGALSWLAGVAGMILVALGLAIALWMEPQSRVSVAIALLGLALLLSLFGFQLHRMVMESQDRQQEMRSLAVRLESQLEQQQRTVDTLADGLDVAIFICDSKASILYANRRAREMFRFDNPIGRSILAVSLSSDLEQLVLVAANESGFQDAELNFAYPEERVGQARAWNPDESPDRVFLSIVEITTLRRLERIRQDFVSNVSHELRTPLTIIRAMSETLLDDDEHDQELLRKYLSKIISEVDRLSTISNDLLILSSSESNIVRKQACDLAEVFQSIVQQLSIKSQDKDLTLEYQGPDSLWIAANTAQMTQVALNLVDNAINYTAHGGIVVKVEEFEDRALATIRDTGVGIASEHLPRIFERFYRVDKARSRFTGGTGLGLSIVKHIVESHGGSVQVQSALNEGTTFVVSLPIGAPSELPIKTL